MSNTDRNQYLLSAVALGLSVLAMIFAFLELRSSDRQLEATVWPYVDLNFNLNDTSFSLAVSNKGLGPALIHEFRLMYDGEELGHPIELLSRGGRDLDGISMTTAMVPDTVLAVGEELTAFTIEGENIGRTIRSVIPDMAIEICYCSINDACWNNYGDQAFTQPVERCETQPVDVEGMLEFFDRVDPPAESEAPDAQDSP